MQEDEVRLLRHPQCEGFRHISHLELRPDRDAGAAEPAAVCAPDHRGSLREEGEPWGACTR